MRRLLLLPALALLIPAAMAQPGAVASLETDKDEYAYGETIELRYTITNEGDEPFTLNAGSESCAVTFTFGTFAAAGEATACTQVEVWYRFEPGASRTWSWLLHPNELAVPESTGEHTITAYFDGYDPESLTAATTFTAPEYLGGRVMLRLAEGVTEEDVQDVADALNAEVIEDWEPTLLWEIEGTTVADAVATYAPDPRFEEFRLHRELYFNASPTTSAGRPSETGTPHLSAPRPNPFTTSTTFALRVPTPGPARVEVFDLLGRRVATLHDGPLAGGAEHRFTFAARGLPSGLYVVRATGAGFSQARRVTLSR